MKVPITLNYDQKSIIGEATLDDTNEELKKVLSTGEYTFRAGFEILEKEGNVITKAKLKEISLVRLPEKYGYKNKQTK